MTNPSKPDTRTLPDADVILRVADNKIRMRVIASFQTERDPKHGVQVPKALGYKAALALARDCYEMGMMDALAAIEEVRR